MEYRTNNQITAPEVRVINEEGQNLGVMPLSKALELAKEKGLDLIEISPKAQPPVTRIIKFDKFRYQQEKELKKQRQAQKSLGLKHVRITARSARNDLEIKARKAQDFLKAGHQVEVQIFLRGREKSNKEWALQKLQEFLNLITVPFEITFEPKFVGRGFIVQIQRK